MSSHGIDTAAILKAGARRRLRTALRALSPARRAADSERIRRLLAAEVASRGARRVLSFAALPDEPDLLPLAFGSTAPGDGSGRGPIWVFPRVLGSGGLELRAVAEAARLVRGPAGIREPDPARCPLVPPEEIDLALVPGLGFRRGDGLRIGRGGGYFDRFLAGAFRGTAIGVGFDCQVVDDLPAEAHDRRVDRIVSPSGWIVPGGGDPRPAADESVGP